MKIERQTIIKRWMLTTVKTDLVDRFNDLHINKIDSKWDSKQEWVEGGLEALRIAIEVRSANGLAVTVAVIFSLISSYEMKDVDFKSQEQFIGQLNWMSPSLYIFPQGKEPWLEVESKKRIHGNTGLSAPNEVFQKLDVELFRQTDLSYNCYYWKFLDAQSQEYSQSIILAG